MSHDFESDDFDPVVALAAVALTLPCDDVQPLSSLAEYEKMVKQKNSTTVKSSETPCLGRKKMEALRASQVSNYFNSYRPKRKAKNVLTIMENIEGPLARLRQCIEDKTMIKVWTRGAKEMRGVCNGFLQAFDRHWNLILLDVDETYAFPKKTKGIPEAKESYEDKNFPQEGASQETLISTQTNASQQSAVGIRASRNRVDLRQRHVRQIFIRGDNVAFVSIMDS